MRKVLFFLFLVFFISKLSAQGILINGTVYTVDTIQHKHTIGQGTTYFSFALPAYPLNVYVMEIDLTNPFVQIETCLSKDSALALERPTDMVKRKTAPGHEVIGATNGDFYFYQDPIEIGIPRSGQFRKNELVANPTGRASFVLGPDDKPYIDRVDFSGVLKKGEKTTRIHTVNMLRLEAESAASTDMMTLYTSAFGHVTSSMQGGVKVIIRPKSGDKFFFGANTDVACIVEDVFPNTGVSLISDGRAVLHGRGKAAEFLESLAKGEEVSVSLGTNLRSSPGLLHDFKELVGGSDNIILLNGERGEGDDLFNPRTGMGISKDKTKVYMMVVDGRQTNSKGATMKDFGEIFRAVGAWNAVNLDGGGSSVMVVNDKMVNSPSDGAVRAVGNGVLVVASPVPNDLKVASIAFDPETLFELPVYGLFRPVVWGYNLEGTLVSKDFKDFTLTCSPGIGNINEKGFFVASATQGQGTITATYNGASVNKEIFVKPASFYMRLDSVLSDTKHPYTLEVIGDLGLKKTLVDPKVFTWTVDNPAICSVENGTLIGLANGTTNIHGKLNYIRLTQKVTVEIPKKQVVSAKDLYDISSFKAKSSFDIIGAKLTSGTLPTSIKYTYSKGDSPFVQLYKEIPLYGIPDSLRIVFNTGKAGVSKAIITLRANAKTSYSPVEFTGIVTGKDQTLSLAINKFLPDADDRASFPVYFEGLKLMLDPAAQTLNEENEISIKEISLIYGGIPDNPSVPNYNIDFVNETTLESIATTDQYSVNPDMSDATMGANAKVPLTPGQNMYFRVASEASPSGIQTLSVPNRPAAPTTPVSDDIINTFDWTNVAPYTNTADYEYTLDNGATWATCSVKPISVGNIALASGAVRVRVKATTSHFVGSPLASIVPYSVDNHESAEIKMYPNPTKDVLYIENVRNKSLISIYSLEGRLLKQVNKDQAKIDLPVSDLSSGMYLLIIRSDNTETHVKFIKE